MHRLRLTTLMLLSASVPTAVFGAALSKAAQGTIHTCQGWSGCTNETIDGRVYKVLRTAEMVVKVSMSTEGEYTRADVSITNNSSAQLEVSPAEFRVDVLTPRPRTLEYVEPASLRLPVVAASDEMKRGGGRRPAGRVMRSLPPKPEPDLAASGVRPDGAVEGKVFFERDRRAKTLNVVLPISGAVFAFPYQVQ